MRKTPLLAINGGTPVRQNPFPAQTTTGEEEWQAVFRVMQNGHLSGYRGAFCNEFMGGPEIRALEKEWCAYFNTAHSIPCNSATSGLHIACGAVGLKPGDEVIVSPYSMTCSATAPLVYGAKPVFADITTDGRYCLDPESVESCITPKTKAIIVVDLFGTAYKREINEIALKHGLIVIEDAAQAIGSEVLSTNNKTIHKTGTLGHIGIYSFNFGKHITCGEGGMIVTDDSKLASKCRLLMNHAEAVIHGIKDTAKQKRLSHLVGFNMRMTEINAAIIREQLKKLDFLVQHRVKNVNFLEEKLGAIPAIGFRDPRLPICNRHVYHSYYVHPLSWIEDHAWATDGRPIHRDLFIEAVKAELSPLKGRESEGVPLNTGYITPLYRMPLFQHLGYNLAEHVQNHPVVESMWSKELFLHRFHGFPTSKIDMAVVSQAFHKVWESRDELFEKFDK